MKNLIEAIIDLVSNSPPDKTEQLAESIRRLSDAQNAQSLTSWTANPRAKNALTELTTAWRGVDIPTAELAGMLTAASAAYHRAKGEQEIELVWTGPSSKLIATRKTEQALLQVIDAAESRLFITSFVAYDVASIMSALRKAVDRGVEVSMLLESSDKHGGGVAVDAIGQMRAALPSALIYFWGDKGDSFAGGKVHAKVAVCDESMCFISSANLTGHAMEKNMEAGVLIRGGSLPIKLQNHLEALVTIKVLKN
ncbi:MAG: DISARM system phospholipase D-like protein DrmC [Candidatus Binataceae bacterium]